MKKASLLAMMSALSTPEFSLKLKFDGNTLDSSGNGLHATAFNNPTYISSDGGVTFDGGLEFNGIDQYVKVNNSASPLLDIGTESMTLGCQLRSSSPPSQCGIIGKGVYGSANGRYALWITNNSYQAIIDLDAPDSLSFGSPYIDNIWHDMVAVFDRDNGVINVYVDGVFVNSQSMNQPAVNRQTEFGFYIGVYGNSNGTQPSSAGGYFKGGIKNVFVKKAVMTGTEVSNVFSNF